MTTLQTRSGVRVIVTRQGNSEVIQEIPEGADDEYVSGRLASAIRTDRSRVLTACDYVMMPDYPASEDARSQWAVYRQALRDLPEQTGFPFDVIWPTEPTIVQ